MLPSPCPLAADVSEIHEDCELALHVQSRSTLTEIVPVPPPEPNEDVEDATVDWHLEDEVLDGATLVDVELPHPPTAKALASEMSARRTRQPTTIRRLLFISADSRLLSRAVTPQLSCRKVAILRAPTWYTESTPAEQL
jgi:hypothetical protein